jgi:hypothetical protein
LAITVFISVKQVLECLVLVTPFGGPGFIYFYRVTVEVRSCLGEVDWRKLAVEFWVKIFFAADG